MMHIKVVHLHAAVLLDKNLEHYQLGTWSNACSEYSLWSSNIIHLGHCHYFQVIEVAAWIQPKYFAAFHGNNPCPRHTGVNVLYFHLLILKCQLVLDWSLTLVQMLSNLLVAQWRPPNLKLIVIQLSQINHFKGLRWKDACSFYYYYYC